MRCTLCVFKTLTVNSHLDQPCFGEAATSSVASRMISMGSGVASFSHIAKGSSCTLTDHLTEWEIVSFSGTWHVLKNLHKSKESLVIMLHSLCHSGTFFKTNKHVQVKADVFDVESFSAYILVDWMCCSCHRPQVTSMLSASSGVIGS